MIDIHAIKQYFPKQVQENGIHHKYMLKEYIQLLILDYLSTTHYIKKITFIRGTHLRLVNKIDRFSEDIDFDCKNLTKDEFLKMTDSVLVFLERSGFQVEPKDKNTDNLKAFRRNIYFPEFLFDLGMSAHKDERFLIKIESQDQLFAYISESVNIRGCGLFFPFPVPSIAILCSMKISALLSRKKGRDFYDVIFLLGLTKPDYKFLSVKMGINNLTELKDAIENMLGSIDLEHKVKDFEHMLFNKDKSSQIIRFNEFMNEL